MVVLAHKSIDTLFILSALQIKFSCSTLNITLSLKWEQYRSPTHGFSLPQYGVQPPLHGFGVFIRETGGHKTRPNRLEKSNQFCGVK